MRGAKQAKILGRVGATVSAVLDVVHFEKAGRSASRDGALPVTPVDDVLYGRLAFPQESALHLGDRVMPFQRFVNGLFENLFQRSRS